MHPCKNQKPLKLIMLELIRVIALCDADNGQQIIFTQTNTFVILPNIQGKSLENSRWDLCKLKNTFMELYFIHQL